MSYPPWAFFVGFGCDSIATIRISSHDVYFLAHMDGDLVFKLIVIRVSSSPFYFLGCFFFFEVWKWVHDWNDVSEYNPSSIKEI